MSQTACELLRFPMCLSTRSVSVVYFSSTRVSTYVYWSNTSITVKVPSGITVGVLKDKLVNREVLLTSLTSPRNDSGCNSVTCKFFNPSRSYIGKENHKQGLRLMNKKDDNTIRNRADSNCGTGETRYEFSRGTNSNFYILAPVFHLRPNNWEKAVDRIDGSER